MLSDLIDDVMDDCSPEAAERTCWCIDFFDNAKVKYKTDC